MLEFLGSQPTFNGEYGPLIDLNTLFRLSFFAGFMILFGFLEIYMPKRKIKKTKGERWFENLTLSAINSILLRLLFGLYIIEMSISLLKSHWGVFNYLNIPLIISIIPSIILLDFAVYISHVAFHKLGILWRFHRVHHTDMEFDVSTGVRFHIIEALISLLLKISIVFMFGIHPIAYVVFEIILNISSLFEHSNINIPYKLDKRLRKIIITPDMHRIHHSIVDEETNSNFGFILSIWDKLFKTYKEKPQKSHSNMTIGLNNYRNKNQLSLIHLLLIIPFKPL